MGVDGLILRLDKVMGQKPEKLGFFAKKKIAKTPFCVENNFPLRKILVLCFGILYGNAYQRTVLDWGKLKKNQDFMFCGGHLFFQDGVICVAKKELENGFGVNEIQITC